MKKLIKIQLRTTNTNIDIPDGKVGKWYFTWNKNIIEAFAQAEYENIIGTEPFDLVHNKNRLNISLLIDGLTILVNQGVNTDIVISSDPKIFIYKVANDKVIKSCADAKVLLRSAIQISNACSLGEEIPKRIDERLSSTFNNKFLNIIRQLISTMSKKKTFRDIDLKLMNYWRKGVDLEQLMFIDESYLAFFKIIEYFINKANIKNEDIPKKYQRPKSLQDAYRFAIGAKIPNLSNEQYQMVANFVYLRNNWDVAHSNIYPLSNNTHGGLYYSHMEEAWEYHSHICQITRLIILKKLGYKNIALDIDGGLYSLVIASEVRTTELVGNEQIEND